MRMRSVGQWLFAATMVGLGVMGMVQGHFAPVWKPVPDWAPAREALAYVCSAISLAAGAGLVWRRTQTYAARVLWTALLLWFVVFRLPQVVLTPSLGTFWPAGETAAMIAAAWVLYRWFALEWDQRYAGFVVGDKGLRVGRALFGFGLVVFGMGHFLLLQYTAGMVPNWLPWHVEFACFTGGAFIAAGLAVMTGICGRLAATLAAVEIGAFLLLVWVPILAGGSRGAFQWSETTVNCALLAAAWLVADSYRGVPWLSGGIGAIPGA